MNNDFNINRNQNQQPTEAAVPTSKKRSVESSVESMEKTEKLFNPNKRQKTSPSSEVTVSRVITFSLKDHITSEGFRPIDFKTTHIALNILFVTRTQSSYSEAKVMYLGSGIAYETTRTINTLATKENESTIKDIHTSLKIIKDEIELIKTDPKTVLTSDQEAKLQKLDEKIEVSCNTFVEKFKPLLTPAQISVLSEETTKRNRIKDEIKAENITASSAPLGVTTQAKAKLNARAQTAQINIGNTEAHEAAKKLAQGAQDAIIPDPDITGKKPESR